MVQAKLEDVGAKTDAEHGHYMATHHAEEMKPCVGDNDKSCFKTCKL